MANWYGASRSNYVKFIPDRLKVLEQLFEIEVVPKGDCHAIISTTYEGGTPAAYEGADKLGLDDVDYFDLLDVVHMALVPEPDNVFVWIEAGHEKNRYITGYATAIDHTGRIVKQINLSDIYEGTNWSRAEY